MTDYTKEMAAAAEAAGLKPARIVQPTDHTVTLGGLTFHYLDWGNDHLPPLVFLHGGRLTAHTWDMASLLLRDHYHIIALDQRGHGDSDWTPEETLGTDTFDLMLTDTERFIDHLGYPKVCLVGMSMGGINTIRYAARHSDRLMAVGIVDVAPELIRGHEQEMQGFDRATETLSSFEDFLDRSRKFLPHRPVTQLRYSLMHSLKQQPSGGWSWKADHRPLAIARSPAVIAKNGAKGQFHDLWDDVKKIGVPALVFWGAQSNTLARDVAERMAKMLAKGAFVAIDPATHNVHSDNPKDFAAALHGFLAKHVS